jgi:hypothetical protein
MLENQHKRRGGGGYHGPRVITQRAHPARLSGGDGDLELRAIKETTLIGGGNLD